MVKGKSGENFEISNNVEWLIRSWCSSGLSVHNEMLLLAVMYF